MTGKATNLSTSISLSFVNENGIDVPFEIGQNQLIELFIPRDPNTVASTTTWIEKSSRNATGQIIQSHLVPIHRESNLEFAVNFEIRPSQRPIAYWLVYRFDFPPHMYPSSAPLVDGWTLFCPTSNTHLSLRLFFHSPLQILQKIALTYFSSTIEKFHNIDQLSLDFENSPQKNFHNTARRPLLSLNYQTFSIPR